MWAGGRERGGGEGTDRTRINGRGAEHHCVHYTWERRETCLFAHFQRNVCRPCSGLLWATAA